MPPRASRVVDDRDVQFLTERDLRGPRGQRSSSSVTVNFEDEELEIIEDIFGAEIIDLTGDDHDFSRQDLLADGEISLASYSLRGLSIRPGIFLEINERVLGKHRITFLLVRVIVRIPGRGQVKFRGVPLARTRHLLAKLPKKPNELCMIIHYNDRNGDIGSQGLIDVTPSQVIGQRTVNLTNAIWPQHQTDITPFRRIHPESERAKASKPNEEALVRIAPDEIKDAKFIVCNDVLRNQWRGGRVKGGSWVPSQGGHADDCIDLDNPHDEPSTNGCRRSGQQYTMFDVFSGAGGVSRGAKMAGFNVKYAVDHWEDVWPTYKANFRDTELFRMSLDECLMRLGSRHIRVDVLHLSPPCQYFSPAHTRPCANDDANIFALFGCNQVIKKTRPRIIIVEQTFGITHDHHVHYLWALIGDFTQYGYSVRWQVVRFATWGAAQDRKRLIIIAAAPGEKLPPFPEATHSEGGRDGLKPFNSIRQAISGLRDGDDLHELDAARYFEQRRAPYDPNRLAGTITTGGTELYYPDGSREFTLRELACLQGFPKNHRFFGNKTKVKKQIGNAFPSNIVCMLYQHIEQWFLREDGMRPYEPLQEDIIMIDDESDTSIDLTDSSELEGSPEMDEDILEIEDGGANRHVNIAYGRDYMVIDLT